MSENRESTAELPELLDALREDVITDAQADRLADLLRGDADARQKYIRYMAMVANLRDCMAGLQAASFVPSAIVSSDSTAHSLDAVERERRQVDREAPPPIAFQSAIDSPVIIHTLSAPLSSFPTFVGSVLFSYVTAALIVGVGLLVAATWNLSDRSQIANHDSPSVTRPCQDRMPQMMFVGQVTGMVDCQWSDPATKAFNGANVPLGRKYALRSGLMEITYDTGAKVILQGPVTYEVESAASGFLSVGKLTARVKTKAEGGRRKAEETTNLPSPLGRGAGGEGGQKYGNHDQLQRALTLALSQGERGPGTSSPLRLPPSALFSVRTPTATVTDLGTEFGVNVSADQSAEVCVFDGIVEVVRSASSTDSKAANTPRRLVANEAMRIEVTGDDKPMLAAEVGGAFVRKLPTPRVSTGLERGLVAYWSFDDATNLGRNATGGGDLTPCGLPSHDAAGLIGGALRLYGDAKKDSLLFNNGQGVPKDIPTGDSSYSISAWYRVDAIPLKGNFDIVGWGEATFGRANAVFLHGIAMEQCMVRNYWWNNDVFENVDMAAATGDWHHVASTYDRRGKMQYLYLDGVRLAARGVDPRPDFDTNSFAIGHRHKRLEPDSPLEWVHGLLDEIGIWNRELSELEILQLYNKGRGLNPLPPKADVDTHAATSEKGGKATSIGR